MANSTTHFLQRCIRGARFTLPAFFYTTAGAATDPTTPDSEISKDGATFADCTEEVTTVAGSNGEGYLTLTGAETDCLNVALALKSANCAQTPIVVTPTGFTIASGTVTAGNATGGTLTSLGFDLTGLYVKTTGGTGGGGTGGANNQARLIKGCTISGAAAAILVNAWETTPDNTTTYDLVMTGQAENAIKANLTAINNSSVPTNMEKLSISSGGAVLIQPMTAGTLTLCLTLTTYTGNTVQTGDNFARIGAPVGASISADIAAAKSDTNTLVGRLTSTRAGYLDNLNVGGLVASAANLLNLTNNTFVASDVPQNLERPDAGSETVPITFIFCDDTGAAKDLDSGNPTLALTNNAGTDLSARLAGGGATWTHVATGEYKILYTNTSTDAIATLHWKVTGTINSVVRKAIFPTQIVDVTAVDFTSSDRTDLQTIAARVDVVLSTRFATSGYTVPPTAAAIRIEMDANSTKLDVAVGTRLATSSYTAPDNTGINTAANQASAANLSIGAVGLVLNNLLTGDQSQFTDTALANAPTGGGGGGATVDEIAARLEADHGAGSWQSATAGQGSIAVNHDTGGTDALRYEHNGSGIPNAVIRAYVKADYDLGTRAVVGQSITGTDGRWQTDMMLDADTYTLTFEATGYELYTVEVAVA